MSQPNRVSWTFAARDEVSDALGDQARAAQRAERAFEGLDRQAKRMSADLTATEKATARLTREMRQAERQARELDRAMAAVGETGVAATVAGGRLRDSRGRFVSAGGAAGAGGGGGAPAPLRGGGGGGLLAGVGRIGGLPPQAVAALAAAGTAASPLIGASVAAAVLGGVGAGGIVGGIALAAQDPRVQSSAEQLGKRVSTAFTPLGAAFVQPTRDAMDALGDSAERVAKNLSLRAVAGELPGLAKGFGDLAEHSVPGLNDALTASRSILRVVGREGDDMGDALSDALSSIAEESDGAVLALQALFDMTEGAVRSLGDGVAFLSSAWEGYVRLAAEVSGRGEDIIGWMPILGDHFRNTNDRTEEWLATLEEVNRASGTFGATVPSALRDIAEASTVTTANIDKMSAAFGDWVDTTRGIQDAAIGWEQAIDDLSESVKENGRSLNIGADAGRNNAKALLHAADAAKRIQEANIAQGMPIQQANAHYAAQVKQLIELGVRLGLTRAEVEKLIGAFTRVPTAPIAGIISPAERSAVRLGRRAAGGPVQPGQSYIVGESGRPEVLTMGDQGGYVHPDAGRFAGGKGGDDISVTAPLVVQLEGQEIWQGLLAFKRRNGLTSLGLS